MSMYKWSIAVHSTLFRTTMDLMKCNRNNMYNKNHCNVVSLSCHESFVTCWLLLCSLLSLSSAFGCEATASLDISSNIFLVLRGLMYSLDFSAIDSDVSIIFAVVKESLKALIFDGFGVESIGHIPRFKVL